jgi:hypothetical protein
LEQIPLVSPAATDSSYDLLGPLAKLAQVMPSVDQVKLTPLASRQRSKERVIQDFRPCAEPSLAIV